MSLKIKNYVVHVKGYVVKDKYGDYSINMIPRYNEVHPVVLNVKYCPVCGKKLL